MFNPIIFFYNKYHPCFFFTFRTNISYPFFFFHFIRFNISFTSWRISFVSSFSEPTFASKAEITSPFWLKLALISLTSEPCLADKEMMYPTPAKNKGTPIPAIMASDMLPRFIFILLAPLLLFLIRLSPLVWRLRWWSNYLFHLSVK